MKISNFEHTGLDRIEEWIQINNIKQIDEKTLKGVLKTINISFVFEEIDRVKSTLICELKNSYVQQSQRYVTLKKDSYEVPILEDTDTRVARELTDKAFKLYEKMTLLKELDFKGRPKAENYFYGIPIEDARYILPLSTKTNVCMAMTGDNLYELFCLINDKKYVNIFAEVREELYNYLPNKLINLLPRDFDSDKNREISDNFYFEELNKINFENNMILLNSFNNLDLKVGLGALTSTQSRTPSDTLILWGEEAESKAGRITERVLGYGHDSIAEQARTTFGMMCSMVTYHQQIRHRLSENYREDFSNIILDNQRPVIVPQSIKESKFFNEYMDLVHKLKNFRTYLFEKYGEDKAFSFILNCDQIKLIVSSNARMDISMLSERICNNAQWEIRELSTKKLNVLRSLSSILYEKALPTCIHGKCKEGKLSCGKQVEMRKKFL